MVDDINKVEFLEQQLDLLKRKQKDSNIEWQDIADFRSDYNGESEHRDTIRKGSKLLYEYLDAGWVHEPTSMSISESDEIIRLKKERQKLSDARVEYNRQIRQEARKESYSEMIKRIICENVEPTDLKVQYHTFNSNTDLLVHLTDIHTGIEINTWNNTFNQDILKERIEKSTSEILKIRDLHKSENCYLVIGEILSGIIHNNLRLQNNMDLMEQFKYISELISAMLIKIANHFNHIYVYVTPGNHSRISPKKEDSLDGENMDVLLPFYLKAKLQNINNIDIYENNIDPEIAMFNIRGNNVFASHGHKDNPASVVQNFTMMFGIKPDIVLLGHRHLNGLTTVYNAKVIESGCCSGTDQYAMSIRKTNRPEQTISVVGQDGLVCLYDIQLD